MQPELRSVLSDGARQLGCPISPDQLDSLLAYLELLAKWNKVYNLTAVRDPPRMLTHHLLDCVSVIVPLKSRLGPRNACLLDVGSGGGLPGVVIATLLPNVHVTCVDAVGKKASFIRQAAGELALPNLQSVHGRVEDIAPSPSDVITSRALSPVAEFVACSARHLLPEGVWLAMKGKYPTQEIAALPIGIEVFHVEQVSVPGLDANRCLVWMRWRA
jgi:16S rRNA (guanine527-N7)-methyltransferase